MIEAFLAGLKAGFWLIGFALPLLGAYIVLGLLGNKFFPEQPEELVAELLDFEEPPELPEAEEAPPAPRHRFIPSTIVRPPPIVMPEPEEDDDES